MDVFDLLWASWPAAEARRLGSWTLRRGDGGGNRVSAATRDGPDADPAPAEAAMRDWGQAPLFLIRPGEAALDATLAARGCVRADPTLILTVSVADIPPPAALAAIPCAAPLACMAEIWDAGGVGPARRAVMDRAPLPKTWLLGRLENRPAGAAFVAARGPGAMLHALEVAPAARRRGLGADMVRGAAAWAASRGAATLCAAVTEANAPARALYAGLGFREAARYHYRRAPEE